MINLRLSSLLAEPAPPDRPVAVSRGDVGLGVAAAGVAALEVALTPAMPWGALLVATIVVVAVSLTVRRTRPLAAVVATFAVTAIGSVAELVATGPAEPASLIVVLALPYALLRWGSGRAATVGVPIMVAAACLGLVADFPGVATSVLGIGTLLLPAAIGYAVRSRGQLHARDVHEAQRLERQQLARDLHDTVAHHVSAITVQAQAGQVIAVHDPAQAIDILRTIEEQAKQALTEMRSVVRVMRADDTDVSADGQGHPTLGVGALPGLVAALQDPRVTLKLEGQISDLPLQLDTAVHRLVQEGATNALRHATGASSITITVAADDQHVTVRVLDDGQSTTPPSSSGFGLIGMRERVEILGGTLVVGPLASGGWQVSATLPRSGAWS